MLLESDISTSKPLLALQVKRADGFFARLAGLLALPVLQPGQALLLVPCSSVHTAFMRYAIDVVFLDRAGTVRKVVSRLRPWRVAACAGSWQTLELAADEAVRLDLRVGLSLSELVSN